MKRILQIAIFVVIGIGIFYFAHRSTLDTVVVYQAKIEPYTHYIYANIDIRAKHMYEIGVSRLPDTIVELPWKVGDHVRKGEVLLRLDTEEEMLTKEKVFAQEANITALAKIKSSTEWSIISTSEELEYMLEDFNKNTTPEVEIRKLKDRLSQLENKNEREKYYQNYTLDKVALQKKGMESAVENNIVSSPITGVIANIYKEPGEFLSVGETAMEIFEDKNLEIIGEVFEEDLEYLARGQSVIIELDAYPGKKFQGKVDMIYPKNDQELQKIEVRLSCDDLPENIAPGLKGLASFEVAYTDFEVVVPATAVFRSNVQLIENGRVKIHPIEIGFRGLFKNVIRSGLPEGSTVLREYRSDLKDGQHVNTATSYSR